MKEATGELSTTVIAVVAIAAVLTIFTAILLPYLKESISAKMHCADAVCNCTVKKGQKCECEYIANEAAGTTAKVYCTDPNTKS